MRVKDLIKQWEETAPQALTAREYRIKLPVRDAARVAALAEMYPQRSVMQILTDLLSSALDEIEEGLPYVQGARIIAEDDQGDPIFEDVGPTSRFRTLSEEFMQKLNAERQK